MAKRMAALHSVHQVCISTCQNDVLMVVGDRSPVDQKKKRKSAKSETFLAIPQPPVIVLQNGLQNMIRRAK